jgi:hypothetical protein
MKQSMVNHPMFLILFLAGLMSILSCGSSEKVSGKTTTTTNGLAIVDSSGNQLAGLRIFAAKETWSREGGIPDPEMLLADESGNFFLEAGTYFLQISRNDGDSGVWISDFIYSGDTTLMIELEKLYALSLNLEELNPELVVVDGALLSAAPSATGQVILRGLPAGEWELLTVNSNTADLRVIAAINEGASEVRFKVADDEGLNGIKFEDFEDANLQTGETFGLAGNWYFFEQQATLIQPADLSQESLLLSLVLDSLTDSQVLEVEAGTIGSGGWVALSLSFENAADIRRVDSLCLSLRSESNLKIEWVRPKGTLDKAPGFFMTYEPEGSDWADVCIHKDEFGADRGNPEDFKDWEEFAKAVSAMQILSTASNSNFAVDNIRVVGSVFQ